jgi:hypothetical protein
MAMCAASACTPVPLEGPGEGPDDGIDPVGVPPGLAFFPAQDTYLTAADPSTSYGSAATIQVGDMGDGADSSTLIAWDLSAIPPLAEVRGAVISLYVTRSAFERFPIYELRRDWTEDQATWSDSDGASWDGAGATGPTDRGDVVLGEIAAFQPGAYEVVLNADGRDVVQRWVDDPTTNHGFVIATAGYAEGIELASREAPNVAQRPLLSVDFVPPAAAARR